MSVEFEDIVREAQASPRSKGPRHAQRRRGPSARSMHRATIALACAAFVMWALTLLIIATA